MNPNSEQMIQFIHKMVENILVIAIYFNQFSKYK